MMTNLPGKIRNEYGLGRSEESVVGTYFLSVDFFRSKTPSNFKLRINQAESTEGERRKV